MLPAERTNPSRSRPEPDVAERDESARRADAESPRSAVRRDHGRRARAIGARVPRRGPIVRLRGLGNGHVGHGNRDRESRRAGHARAVGRDRILCRSTGADGGAVRRRSDAHRSGVGPRDRSRSGPPGAPGIRRRCRDHRARRNLDGRAQSRAGRRGDRARAWRAGDRRCRHLAWRHAARCRRVGPRRRLQLQPEVSRRAVGHVADRLLAARARTESGVPQLLLRRHAARGLLGASQVSPHDVGVVDLRASRSAGQR